MPVVLNGLIVLPSVRLYTSFTVLMMSACLYYALIMTSDPNWRAHTNLTASALTDSTEGVSPATATATAATAAAIVATTGAQGAPSLDGAGGKLDASAGAGTGGASILSVAEIESLEEKILAAADLPDQARQMLRVAGAGDDAAVHEPAEHSASDSEQEVDEEEEAEEEDDDEEERWSIGNDTRTFGAYLKDTATFMAMEPFCIWTLINTAYCCLILLGKSIQKFVFGELRISEQQHMKDKFWNFIFYKFIFVFGVVNVQYLYEVILWVSWFSALGFLHLLSQLSKDRFEYLSFSPTTPGWSHFRLLSLLGAILTLAGLMVVISIGVGVFVGSFNTFAFMSAECILLAIRTLHVLIRYGMFLHDMRQGRIGSESISWDKRGPVAYYFELSFEMAALAVDLLHHMHMLLWSNIFLSMASLVIIMQLRYLFNEIQRKIKKHRNYLWVLKHMEKSYPLATAEDLKQNSDNCAICWEKMETARKLPCCHLFHNSCLQSWLEQDTSCPTCRLALSVHQHGAGPGGRGVGSPGLLPNDIRIDDQEPTTMGGGRTANNHFFHFNGSRYVSWLPNFSVEVTHINNMLRPGIDTIPLTAAAANHTSQVRNMARHVQEMFPRYPLSVLIADLQISRSIEVTIDNILDGRLVIPSGNGGAGGMPSSFEDEEEDGGLVGVPASPYGGGRRARLEHGGEHGQHEEDDEFYPASATDDPSPVSSESSGSPSPSSSSSSPSSSPSSSSLSSPVSPAGYEVERGTKIFGCTDTLLRDDSSGAEEPPLMGGSFPFGVRFSKSPEEREQILQRRKEQLVAIARRRYLEKNKSELNQRATTAAVATSSSSSSGGGTVKHRNKSCMETTTTTTPVMVPPSGGSVLHEPSSSQSPQPQQEEQQQQQQQHQMVMTGSRQ
ncbi:E3 ubiquitin-protein ligase AMFR-like [Anopheles aquasalis]|uniref:E3 ubiquitin-protein ligase AMFR-like n=1 Tax=Anopheles aquasalis TaxID=42839 RepID=UPI00215AB5FA|nr:E3 ubiquitin-protein ligase AMFR-like [Anopheles aquasalis]XP_050096861.1 E3 ubiquitin-protein ligase AMFR-like [Anopheles aquasalis]